MDINELPQSDEGNNHVSASSQHRRSLVISVEGNIGSGKTTFLTYCISKPNIDVHLEPVEKWKNFNDVNLLVKFYEKPSKWAMTFQIYVNVVNVNMTMLDIYQEKSYKPIKLVERSLLSSRYCFIENMRATGILEPAMANVLDEWYERTFKDYRSVPQAIVYIQTSPEVAHNRMLRRVGYRESGATETITSPA